MGLDARQLRLNVVRPTLQYLDLAWRYSLVAENLLLGTAAHESGGFRWLLQRGGGPARSLWQIEPETMRDIVDRYLLRPDQALRRDRVMRLASSGTSLEGQLVTNLAFSCAIARVKFAMSPAPLPDSADDIGGLAQCYKIIYNTNQGAATVDQFKSAYLEFVK